MFIERGIADAERLFS